MRSNMFANIENKFEFATEKEIVDTALCSLAEFIEATPNFSKGPKLSAIILGTRLGVVGDGIINSKEKMLINEVFGKIWKGSMEEIYDAVNSAIKEEDYDLVRLLTQLGNHVAMPFLYYVLSFAYIDGVFEDEVAEKLDGIFGINLLGEFLSSDLEEVPAPKIKLTGFEAEIVRWFQSCDTLIPLKEIQSHFSHKSKSAVKAALDSLCKKNILFGGENIINDLYGLVNKDSLDSADIIVLPDKKGKSAADEVSKRKAEQKRAAGEKKAEEGRKRQEAAEKRAAEEKKKQEIEKNKVIVQKCLDQIEAYKTQVKVAVNEKKDRTTADVAQRIEQLKAKKQSHEATLKSLGLFRFSDKKREKEEITRIETEIEMLSQPGYLSDKLKKIQQSGDASVKKYKADVERFLAKKYNLDYKPEMPEEGVIDIEALYALENEDSNRYVTATQKSNELLKLKILKIFYDAKQEMTVTDMVEQLEKGGDYLNNQKVSPLANQLVEESYLSKRTEKRCSYFAIADRGIQRLKGDLLTGPQKTGEPYEENKSYSEQKCPEMPNIEEVI